METKRKKHGGVHVSSPLSFFIEKERKYDDV